MPQTEDSHPLTVLVADRDPAVLRVAREALSHRGLRIMTASTASEALRAAQAELIDVAFVGGDIRGGGKALRRRLEALPELRGHTIVLPDHRRLDADRMVQLVEALADRS